MSATLQNIVQRHMSELGPMSIQQRKTLMDIATCGTPARGEVVMRCDRCDKTQRHWASCGNRHCNRCGHHRNAKWLENQLEHLLPVPYFMVTLTVPEHLRDLFRYNQKICYDLLFRCGVDAVHSAMRHQQKWGDHIKVGSAAFLHTWTQDLNYHPHLHMVVPAGGYDAEDREWHEIGKSFLATYRVISPLFKGKLCDALAQLYKRESIVLPPSMGGFESPKTFKSWLQGKRDIHWRIHVSKPYGESGGAMDYMARYVNRTAIGNNRILHASDEKVVIQTRDRKANKDRQVQLKPLLFLKRFLTHILPKGFTRVRWFGWLSCAKRKQAVTEIREALDDFSPATSTHQLCRVVMEMSERLKLRTCSHCEQGTLVFSSLLAPKILWKATAELYARPKVNLSPH